MTVPSAITDLSTSPALNSPAGTDTPKQGDDHIRAAYAFIRQLYDSITTILSNLTTTGNTVLGDSTADTLNVGNGGIVKDASGNTTIGGTLKVNSGSGAWFNVGGSLATSNYGSFKTTAGATLGYIGGGAGAAISGGTADDLALRAVAGNLYLTAADSHAVTITTGGEVGLCTVGFGSSNLNGFTVEPIAGGVITTIAHNTGAAGGTPFIQFLRDGIEIGSVVQNGTTGVLFGTTSDRRLKTNFRQFEFNAGHVLRNTVPCTYDWKASGEAGHGYLAQQLNRFYPPAVTKGKGKGKNATPWQVDFSKMVPLLHVRLVEMEGEIKALRAELKARG